MRHFSMALLQSDPYLCHMDINSILDTIAIFIGQAEDWMCEYVVQRQPEEGYEEAFELAARYYMSSSVNETSRMLATSNCEEDRTWKGEKQNQKPFSFDHNSNHCPPCQGSSVEETVDGSRRRFNQDALSSILGTLYRSLTKASRRSFVCSQKPLLK